MEDLKKMTALVWFATAGVVVCFAGTVYTVVQRHHEAQAAALAVGVIPMPAGITTAPQPLPQPLKDPNSIPVPAR